MKSLTPEEKSIQKENIERLTAAKKLIQKGWTQGHYAEDKDGSIVSYNSPTASRFCLMGAVHLKVAPTEYLKAALGSLTNTGRLVKYNDTPGRTKKEVLALFARAIKLARKKII